MTGQGQTIRLYGPSRRAWLFISRMEITLRIGGESRLKPTEDDPFAHDQVTIDFITGKRSFFIVLTSFTEEELDALNVIFSAAIEAARPVVRSLDALAQQEADAGATYLAPRIFRARPNLVIRDLKAKVARGRTKNTPDNKKEPNDETERSAYASEGPTGL